jgi:hypothetical protein
MSSSIVAAATFMPPRYADRGSLGDRRNGPILDSP